MKEDAQKVIDLLNGFEFRGRKLTVSYSRKKEEADS
jgi:RNA recognition motif-containing protein